MADYTAVDDGHLPRPLGRVNAASYLADLDLPAMAFSCLF